MVGPSAQGRGSQIRRRQGPRAGLLACSSPSSDYKNCSRKILIQNGFQRSVNLVATRGRVSMTGTCEPEYRKRGAVRGQLRAFLPETGLQQHCSLTAQHTLPKIASDRHLADIIPCVATPNRPATPKSFVQPLDPHPAPASLHPVAPCKRLPLSRCPLRTVQDDSGADCCGCLRASIGFPQDIHSYDVSY